jgi:broad specificity phosphatase PhoE
LSGFAVSATSAGKEESRRAANSGAAMILVLVRHGESEGNAGVGFAGEEPHLTDRGRRQAVAAARRAAGRRYHALYSSPMSRALETAAAIAEAIGLEPAVFVDCCEHRGLERFRGFPRSLLAQRYPQITLPDDCTEEGWWTGAYEDEAALYARAGRFAAMLRAEHPVVNDRILLVTHGGFGSALLSVLLGLPPCGYLRFDMDNAAFSRIDLAPGFAQVRAINSTWHLPVEDGT